MFHGIEFRITTLLFYGHKVAKNLTMNIFIQQVMKVWDIKEHSCLQTVVLKFPSSIHGRMPEHGTFPMHMQPAPHNALLVTCNDYIGMLKLGHTSQPKNLDAVTHDSQLCGAIYNKTFKQVNLQFCYSMAVTNCFILSCIEFTVFHASLLKIFSREEYNGRK